MSHLCFFAFLIFSFSYLKSAYTMRLSSVLRTFALATGVLSKSITDVFTSIDSITYAGESGTAQPFGTWDVVMSWSIDSSTAATGDQFYLFMPYVFDLPIYNSAGDYSNALDLTLDGQTIASCDVNTNTSPVLETVLICQVTADLSSYSVISGTVEFPVVFNGGGRIDSTDAAQQWTTGSNTVTWSEDSDLTGTVTFDDIDTQDAIFLSEFNMAGQTFFYFLTPEYLCDGGAVSSGSLSFSSTGVSFDISENLEAYIALSLNPFGEPTDSTSIDYTVVDGDGATSALDTFTITFGAIPAGGRLWVSSFATSQASDPDLFWTLNVTCASGLTTVGGNSQAITLDAVARSLYLYDPLATPTTVTVTTTWTDSQIATSFVTGTDSVVTEIIGGPAITGTVTQYYTSTWTVAYPTTITESFTTNQTDITVDYLYPDSATYTITTTVPWTGSYTLTLTEPIYNSNDNVVSVFVVTPISTTTITEAWTGSYITTSTEATHSGATLVTVIVEAPIPTTTTTTTTEPWSGSYLTTITEPTSSGETVVTVDVETPVSTTTTSEPSSASLYTSSLIEPVSSGEPSSASYTSSSIESSSSVESSGAIGPSSASSAVSSGDISRSSETSSTSSTGESVSSSETFGTVVETPVVSSDQSSAPDSSIVSWNQTYTVPSLSDVTPSGSTLVILTTETGVVTSTMTVPCSTASLSSTVSEVTTSVSSSLFSEQTPSAPSSSTKTVQVPTESSFTGVSSAVPAANSKSTSSSPHTVSTGTSPSEPHAVTSSPVAEPSTITYTTGTITATVVVSAPQVPKTSVSTSTPPSPEAQTSVNSSPSSSTSGISVFEGMASVRSTSLFTMFGLLFAFMI